jgi:hypothetical protein
MVPFPDRQAQNQFNTHWKKISELENAVEKANLAVEKTNIFILGMVFVFFLGLAGLFVAVDEIVIDHFRAKEESYQMLIEKINQQNNKIDIIFERLREKRK